MKELDWSNQLGNFLCTLMKTKRSTYSPIISALYKEVIHSIADLMYLSHNDIEQLQYTVFQSKQFLSYEEYEWIKSLISHIHNNEIFSNDELYHANIPTLISSGNNDENRNGDVIKLLGLHTMKRQNQQLEELANDQEITIENLTKDVTTLKKERERAIQFQAQFCQSHD